MADVDLTLTDLAEDEVNPGSVGTSMASADDYYYQNTQGTVILHLRNDTGGSATVTIETPFVLGSKTLQDHSVTIPTGEGRVVGPRNPKYYNNTEGKVHVSTDTDNVVIAALRA